MVNNMRSPVLFEEGLAFIPQQAVLVEIAPHGLMQAILKRALPECMHIPLTQRGNPQPLRFLLNALGKYVWAPPGAESYQVQTKLAILAHKQNSYPTNERIGKECATEFPTCLQASCHYIFQFFNPFMWYVF